jgi:hypothetical protein
MLTDAAIAVMHKINISTPFTMSITKHSTQKIPIAKFTGFLILTYASLHSLISNSGHHFGFPCSIACQLIAALRRSSAPPCFAFPSLCYSRPRFAIP